MLTQLVKTISKETPKTVTYDEIVSPLPAQAAHCPKRFLINISRTDPELCRVPISSKFRTRRAAWGYQFLFASIKRAACKILQFVSKCASTSSCVARILHTACIRNDRFLIFQRARKSLSYSREALISLQVFACCASTSPLSTARLMTCSRGVFVVFAI